jgi:hypothetical protein
MRKTPVFGAPAAPNAAAGTEQESLQYAKSPPAPLAGGLFLFF